MISHFGKNLTGIVITGQAARSGKTIMLKTLGLAQLMARGACPVYLNGSAGVAVFLEIFYLIRG